MPKHIVPIEVFYPLIGDMNVDTKTHSTICISGILPFLQVKFPTLQLDVSQNYNGKYMVTAQAEKTSLAIVKLDQYVDYIGSISKPRRFDKFLNRFEKFRTHIEVLIAEPDLAEVMDWLIQNCKRSEYIIITRYIDCTMVCLSPEKAMRFKLWYPGK